MWCIWVGNLGSIENRSKKRSGSVGVTKGESNQGKQESKQSEENSVNVWLALKALQKSLFPLFLLSFLFYFLFNKAFDNNSSKNNSSQN